MERLVAAYRVSSSPIALGALVLGNLIPVVGVVVWGWSLVTILVLYWTENGIIGAYNILKIVLAQGGVFGTRSPIGIGAIVGRIWTALFFTLHYGIFWAGHGVFVWFGIPALTGDPVGPDPGAVVLGAVAMALSHGASLLFNYLGRSEFRTATATQQLFAPYGRVVILHLAILGGAFVTMILGTPLGALLILVGLKIAVDVAFHLREHRGLVPEFV